MGIREHGGDLCLVHIGSATAENLGVQIKEHVDPKVKTEVTDEWQVHPTAMITAEICGKKDETIRHRDKIYVAGEVQRFQR